MQDTESLSKQLADLKLLNEDLQQKNRYLTDFVENATIPLHWVDSQGIITWANQAELDLLGYDKLEYIGKNVSQFHADLQTLQDIQSRISNHEDVLNYPAKLLHKDGSIKHVLINSNVFREDGKFIHTRCFTRDVTNVVRQRNEAEAINLKLKESEARLRLAIDSTDLGTWDWNRRRKIIYWSAECRRIIGLMPKGRLAFDDFLDRIHPDDRPAIDVRIDELVNDKKDGYFDMTFRIYRIHDNRCRWIRAQGTVFIGSDNTLNRFLGTMLDVTVSRNAREQNARLAAVVQSSDDAIVAKTLNGYVTTWNDSAERLFGYTAKEMVGQSILKIIPPERYQEEQDILIQMRNGNPVKHFETLRLTKSGDCLDVSLTISPIRDEDGNIIGISKIARDITERKEEEKRKNDFISVVSHELKTPLTSILLYGQLLVRKTQLEQFSELHQLSMRVESHAKRMNLLIGDYLNLTRIEEGKAELNLGHFDLEELITEVVEDAKLFGSPHQFKIEVTPNVTVHADRDKICQVLTNLVSNAVKYSPSGGEIYIGSESINDNVHISVKDHGLGITEEDQKNLFQRFYRVKDKDVKNISGFGIGLYLVSELLRMHGSHIMLESKKDVGSTFSFVLTKQ